MSKRIVSEEEEKELLSLFSDENFINEENEESNNESLFEKIDILLLENKEQIKVFSLRQQQEIETLQNKLNNFELKLNNIEEKLDIVINNLIFKNKKFKKKNKKDVI